MSSRRSKQTDSYHLPKQDPQSRRSSPAQSGKAAVGFESCGGIRRPHLFRSLINENEKLGSVTLESKVRPEVRSMVYSPQATRSESELMLKPTKLRSFACPVKVRTTADFCSRIDAEISHSLRVPSVEAVTISLWLRNCTYETALRCPRKTCNGEEMERMS